MSPLYELLSPLDRDLQSNFDVESPQRDGENNTYTCALGHSIAHKQLPKIQNQIKIVANPKPGLIFSYMVRRGSLYLAGGEDGEEEEEPEGEEPDPEEEQMEEAIGVLQANLFNLRKDQLEKRKSQDS